MSEITDTTPIEVDSASEITQKAQSKSLKSAHLLDEDSNSSGSTNHKSKKLKTGPSSQEIKVQKDQVSKELDELKSKIAKKNVSDDSDSENDNFVDILDSAFDTVTAEKLSQETNKNLDVFNEFLEEHKKIDEKLLQTKKSKFFTIKSKTRKVRKSNSMSSFKTRSRGNSSGGQSTLYELDNNSKASLSSKIMRRMSTHRKSGSGYNLTSSISQGHELHKPPTLEEVSSETESDGDKEVITYKKVFKDNKELTEEQLTKLRAEKKAQKLEKVKENDENNAVVANDTTILDDPEENIETFQFQFEFSKIKLDEDKLKFSDSVNEAIEQQTAEEGNSTTLISNSNNGKIVTTTIRPKHSHGNKGLFGGLGIGNGIASIYSSFFGWGKR